MTARSILLHTRASGGGGAERVFATLASGLAARGRRVVLAVDHVEPGFRAGAGVELVETGGGHGRAVLRLAGLIRGLAPDVVAGAVSVSNVKLAAAAVLAGRGTPLVLSYHGFEEWKTGRLSALAYTGMPLLRRRAARIVAVSDGLAAELVGRWGADPARTVRIYNPVALPPPVPLDPAALAARAPLVAAVGRLSPEKGLPDLVEAFARVTTANARLAIAGEGPDRPAVEAAIARHGLGGRVTLLGAVDGSAALFGTARVAAVPSRTEAFGMAVVEALAAGPAVVATDCPGPAEILGGGAFGRLVPVGDPAAMAAALDAALADPGDPAPRQARAAGFDVAHGLDAWEALLDAVVREAVRR